MANAGLTGKNGGAMLPRMEEWESCKCTGLPWTPDECDVVDEALDPVEAWENYRAKFGTARTMASILSRWYRKHKKNSNENTPLTREIKRELDLLELML